MESIGGAQFVRGSLGAPNFHDLLKPNFRAKHCLFKWLVNRGPTTDHVLHPEIAGVPYD